MDLKDIYPLTIIKDRYNGCYSGGKYLAFRVDHWDVPEEIGGDDMTENNFWAEESSSEFVGKGDTISEAVADLKRRILDVRY